MSSPKEFEHLLAHKKRDSQAKYYLKDANKIFEDMSPNNQEVAKKITTDIRISDRRTYEYKEHQPSIYKPINLFAISNYFFLLGYDVNLFAETPFVQVLLISW